MVTLKDIAQHLGISVSAASMALRNHESIGEDTKRRVWAAKEELGYRVRSKPTGNIAFVLFDRGFDSTVYARFFQSIGEMAIKRQRQPLLLALDSTAFLNGDVPPILQKKGVDGIIVSGVYQEASHKILSSLGIPLVALGVYQLGEDPWAACEVDISGGLRLAVRTLAELNHRRIGFLASSPETIAYGHQIREAYIQAIAKFGVESAGIAEESPSAASEGSGISEGFYQLMKRPNAPTALIVEKAHSAIYDGCDALGLRIPADVSILSLGRSAERMRPSLVNVESNPEQMAKAAFEKLERLIENPGIPLTREVFGMGLIPGDSIGPAKKAR